jgi:hypothetical protein
MLTSESDFCLLSSPIRLFRAPPALRRHRQRPLPRPDHLSHGSERESARGGSERPRYSRPAADRSRLLRGRLRGGAGRRIRWIVRRTVEGGAHRHPRLLLGSVRRLARIRHVVRSEGAPAQTAGELRSVHASETERDGGIEHLGLIAQSATAFCIISIHHHQHPHSRSLYDIFVLPQPPCIRSQSPPSARNSGPPSPFSSIQTPASKIQDSRFKIVRL